VAESVAPAPAPAPVAVQPQPSPALRVQAPPAAGARGSAAAPAAKSKPPAKAPVPATPKTKRAPVAKAPVADRTVQVPRQASGNGGVAAKVRTEIGTKPAPNDAAKPSAADKPVSPMSAGMQKKSTRRGIRLKVDNGQDSDFE
jgi:hypothetical protein